MNVSGIDCYEKEGTVYLKLEAVARGLGFTTVAASGNEVIRWNTVHKYLTNLGVATSCNGSGYREQCPQYVSESVFYRLAMKAKNETAEKFQVFIAEKVIPSIRKYGAYMEKSVLEKTLEDPDFLIGILQDMKAEREKNKELTLKNTEQQKVIAEQSQEIEVMKPKVKYYDIVLACEDLIAITVIAKDYGMSAEAMNDYLHKKRIQYKRDGVWVLYQEYCNKGYTGTKTHTYFNSKGESVVKIHTYWTQKGRLFLYDILKADGILPCIEQEDCTYIKQENYVV